ncbi:hypothetical protein HWB52_gp89 [Pseudomonas phage Littlefix]|uniref:Uncharacterized protein n=1 Tax=Pseudomonas phage Littlefix TaxID=2079289 RepID=A0A2K9VHT7_9CAUD|nr:hypothetical protein HWB52_gp89 [Pseudomonas phage Littlefix]AUV61904.1 hypothetical protein PsPhLittlefix_gp89 [Pseudomonas phage Littlefix]
MAEYGLEIKNVANVVQIDGNFNNLAFRSKGTAVLGEASGSTGMRYARITTGASPTSMVAVKTNGYTYLANVIDNGNGTRTYVWIVDPGTTVTYYIFDEIEYCPPRTDKYGLIVKNKVTGKVAFDSRYKYMRVVQMLTINDFPAAWPGQSTYPMSTPNPGFVQGVTGYYLQAVPEGDPTDPGNMAWGSIYGRVCVKSSGATAYLQTTLMDQAHYPPGFPMPPQATYRYTTHMVLDLTGM